MGSIAGIADMAKQVLDARVASHAVISSNISNASTPGYQAKVPSFSVQLDQASAMLEGGEMLSGQEPKWKLEMKVLNSSSPSKENGNNVQMEKEMASLADNSLNYMSAVKILNKEFAITRYAITSR